MDEDIPTIVTKNKVYSVIQHYLFEPFDLNTEYEIKTALEEKSILCDIMLDVITGGLDIEVYHPVKCCIHIGPIQSFEI